MRMKYSSTMNLLDQLSEMNIYSKTFEYFLTLQQRHSRNHRCEYDFAVSWNF